MTGNQASPSPSPAAASDLTASNVGASDVAASVTAEVRRHRESDPLGRITVIVASFGAARDLVRALALNGGAVGVAVRTASQIVTELAGPALAPRAPLPFPLLAAAVERALDADSGRLHAVASEPVTADAVAQACLRLGTVEPGSVTPQTPLHTEVLRLAEQAHAATGSAYYPQVEAVTATLERLDLLGHVILAAPLRGTEAERRLGSALDARGVLPVPGSAARNLAPATDPGGTGAVTGTHVLHASDSDDEVRSVVRFVRARLAGGVPGHRIGVYYPSPDPYLRLLLRAFGEAGITVNGPSTTVLGRTAAGRSLVRLLRLDREETPRASLLSVVAEGAMEVDDDEGRPVSSRRLELLTRSRIPVLGGADWDRLASAATDPDSGLFETERSAASALSRLVRQVRTHLAVVDESQSWAEVSSALGALVTALLRAGPERSAVLAVVGSLGDLDLVAPALTRERVVGAVATRLDSIADRVGDEGAGVTLGPVDDAVGRDLDTVCVVGMAEGLLPVLHRPDPLLPEGAVEPPATELLDERYRVLQLALAAGSVHRLCSFPRGSMRGGGDRIPSRWLLPTLATLTGAPVHATRWQADVADCPRVTAIPSFVEGVLSPPDALGSDPATPSELRIRAIAAAGWTVSAVPPTASPPHAEHAYAEHAHAEHPHAELHRPDLLRPDLVSPELLRRAHEMRRDRRRGIFSRFTGDVSSARDHLDVLATPVSPSRLEDWAQSPYLFFLTTVLRVRTLDEPAAEIEMDLRDYGELVHTILERYVSERITEGSGPDRDLLERILREECDRAVDSAPGLVASLWRRREDLLASELRRWFEEDSADADAGWRPEATELGFGRPEVQTEVPYEVPTSDGPRTLRLAGSIDRLDIRGGLQRVTDYKTGKAPRAEDRPGQDDPTMAGTRFQLPLYAAAAATARDRPVGEVRYWYCTERGEFEQISLSVTDELMEQVRTDVGNLVDAIEKGWFPLKGGRGSARDLADLLGGGDLDRTWELLSRREPLASHPAFAGIVAETAHADQTDIGTERHA